MAPLMEMLEHQHSGKKTSEALAYVKGTVSVKRRSHSIQTVLSSNDERVVKSNYHQHPLVKMSQASPIEEHWLKSKNLPSELCQKALPPNLSVIADAMLSTTSNVFAHFQ